jgi:hypothetical protein
MALTRVLKPFVTIYSTVNNQIIFWDKEDIVRFELGWGLGAQNKNVGVLEVYSPPGEQKVRQSLLSLNLFSESGYGEFFLSFGWARTNKISPLYKCVITNFEYEDTLEGEKLTLYFLPLENFKAYEQVVFDEIDEILFVAHLLAYKFRNSELLDSSVINLDNLTDIKERMKKKSSNKQIISSIRDYLKGKGIKNIDEAINKTDDEEFHYYGIDEIISALFFSYLDKLSLSYDNETKTKFRNIFAYHGVKMVINKGEKLSLREIFDNIELVQVLSKNKENDKKNQNEKNSSYSYKKSFSSLRINKPADFFGIKFFNVPLSKILPIAGKNFREMMDFVLQNCFIPRDKDDPFMKTTLYWEIIKEKTKDETNDLLNTHLIIYSVPLQLEQNQSITSKKTYYYRHPKATHFFGNILSLSYKDNTFTSNFLGTINSIITSKIRLKGTNIASELDGIGFKNPDDWKLQIGENGQMTIRPKKSFRGETTFSQKVSNFFKKTENRQGNQETFEIDVLKIYSKYTGEDVIIPPTVSMFTIDFASKHWGLTQEGNAFIKKFWNVIGKKNVVSLDISILGDPTYVVYKEDNSNFICLLDIITVNAYNSKLELNDLISGEYYVMGFNHKINKGEFITQLKLQKIIKKFEKPGKPEKSTGGENIKPPVIPENFNKSMDEMIFGKDRLTMVTSAKNIEKQAEENIVNPEEVGNYLSLESMQNQTQQYTLTK